MPQCVCVCVVVVAILVAKKHLFQSWCCFFIVGILTRLCQIAARPLLTFTQWNIYSMRKHMLTQLAVVKLQIQQPFSLNPPVVFPQDWSIWVMCTIHMAGIASHLMAVTGPEVLMILHMTCTLRSIFTDCGTDYNKM